jgi:hypothetical protein
MTYIITILKMIIMVNMLLRIIGHLINGYFMNLKKEIGKNICLVILMTALSVAEAFQFTIWIKAVICTVSALYLIYDIRESLIHALGHFD